MKYILMSLTVMSMALFSCSHSHTHEEEHADDGFEAVAYTIYTDKTELFVEFKPLVVNSEVRFAAHFTKLGEVFTPYTRGAITLSVNVGGKTVSVSSDTPQVAGIYRLRLTPNTAGVAKLVFDIKTKEYTDQIIIDSIPVYASEKDALANQHEEGGASDITYLKEQAWKVEFANTEVKRQPFSYVIKTSGQILSAFGDEQVITAKANGLVSFAGGNIVVGSPVNAGANLFTVTAGDLADGNLDASYKELKANYEKAKSEYERNVELIKDKIVSEKDFQQSKAAFENAQTAYSVVSKNYSKAGIAILSPIAGYIKNVLVTEGQYVTTGTPLATVSKNRKLMLQANVSQRYFDKLSSISSANFKTSDNGKLYSTSQLDGKVISYGRSIATGLAFVPITFEINNTGSLLSGTTAEVYLKSYSIPNVLTLPVSALLEEQGNFFVYVQTAGESFQKREVEIGMNDGLNAEVISGVAEGERVVSKGAYQIKLSSSSGTLPAHGHEH